MLLAGRNSTFQSLPHLSDTDAADDTAEPIDFLWSATTEREFDENAMAFRAQNYEVHHIFAAS